MRSACLVLLGVFLTAPVSAQIVVPSPAAAQSLVPPPPAPRVVNLSGPRFGVTALGDGIRTELAARGLAAPSMISQFGWQLEKAFYTKDSGVAAVSEWVLLLGGLEHDMAIPSLTWLVGMRTATGAEFGVGPNVSAAGTGLAIAAGVTIRQGFLNIPMNVAVVPSKNGTRVSFLTGFNMRRR